MTQFAEQIAALRQLVDTASDLIVPFRYFMDNLAMNESFISSSSRTDHDQLQQIIKKATKHYFNETITSDQFLIMTYDDDTSFIHGVCFVPNKLLAFFYYTNLQIGMSALVDMKDPGMTHSCRFRTLKTANNKLTFHPGNPSVIH